MLYKSFGHFANCFFGSHIAIKNVVHAIEDRGINIVFLVDLINTICAIISFGNLFHLHFSHFHRIALANERSEVVVARESRVGGNE